MSDPKSNKSEKYDRQLRLWATNGQSNIENCHICLIGITTTNIELLKNLVLPGCGNFTIIDHDDSKDFSHNFFWSEESSIVDNLKSLNPDVNGVLIKEPISKLIEENSASFWNQFTIVIMDDSIETYEHERKLVNMLWEADIPVLKNVSYGFYGITRVMVKEHSIIETHPESLVDLRVENPWEELEEYAESLVLENMDDVDHAHVPYVAILVKLLKQWKEEHNGETPTQKSRSEFRKSIEKMARPGDEANFREASQFSHRATNPPVLKQSVADIINSTPEPNLSTSIFWIYTKALQSFMKKHNNQLPLSGVLPDMTADTANYVTLQNIYKRKFLKDRDDFIEELRLIITSIGRSNDEISEEMANTFCKNSRFLTVQKGSKEPLSNSLLSELSPSHHQETYFKIYLAFLTVENLKKNGKKLELYSKERNFENLKESVIEIFKKFDINQDFQDEEFEKIILEIARSGGSELHNVASLMGGIGSQEALKFITGQYVPIDNLVVFDGIVSHTECFKI